MGLDVVESEVFPPAGQVEGAEGEEEQDDEGGYEPKQVCSPQEVMSPSRSTPPKVMSPCRSTSPQSGIKSPFFRSLICASARRNPVSCGAHNGN